MSTGLKVYENNEIAALDPQSEAALAFRENNEGMSFGVGDLIKVTVPSSGVTIWTIEGTTGREMLESIEGIVVFKAPHGLIWRGEDPKKKEKPVVVSNDLVTGRLNIPREEVPEEMMEVLDQHELDGKPGIYDWAKLPYNQWGTGKKGIGKYGKEQILLFILRPQKLLPILIAVPPGSLANIKSFYRHSEISYYRMMVSLKLKEELSRGGTTYSQIIPTQTGTISKEDGEALCKMYRDPLKKQYEDGLIELDSPLDADESGEG